MTTLSILFLFAMTSQYIGIMIGMFVWINKTPIERERIEKIWREL